MTKYWGWLLGLENVGDIDRTDVTLAAAWAQGRLFWIFLGCVVLMALAGLFYARYQPRGSGKARAGLAVCRGLLLVVLLITLADPVIRITQTSTPRPLLYLLFDGTESMAIEDELTDEQKKALARAIETAENEEAKQPASRLDYLKSYLSRQENNLVEKIRKDKDYRVEAFVFDGENTSRLRKLEANEDRDAEIDPRHVAKQLSASGQVTAIGSALDDLSRQYARGNLGAVVMFGDFAQNSGLAPVGAEAGFEQSPAQRLGIPVYTVGLGATSAIDLAVDIQTPPKMKKAERSTITVKLSQMGLEGQAVTARVIARALEGADLADITETELQVGEETVTLATPIHYVDIPFTPKDAGRFEFVAEVEPVSGEIIEDNNRARRQVNIIDDYLRLMYVAYEPTWEWRFVKEVFHRDKLVGLRGFRTFLRSADPKVRQQNELFLRTLTPQRSQFFANDVLFLGDMPAAALSERFCEMTKEFVSQFGGGLVVIAGPRFGPGELAKTPLADMLPVKVDQAAKLRDQRPFRMRITPLGLSTDFMQLGGAEDESENLKAWDNMGPLPWYQPVTAVHSQANVLAEHPRDTCSDGKTPQPIIAIRKYGSAGGEVVYIAFNETWRLRRRYGELYYRQFWSQLINRLGLSHALGAQKRFVIRTDRQNYRSEDRVTLTVEAYDEEFEPLIVDKLPEGQLTAEMIVPDKEGQPGSLREITLSPLRDGIYEARIPVFDAGEYQIRIKDPVAERFAEVRFAVTGLSAERRSATRNVSLQQQLATATGGKAYDLESVESLVDELNLVSQPETRTRVKPLWSTPLWFGVVVLLMLGEWFSRKMMNLT